MSTDINQVVLVGRLTREAELKYTNSGTPVSNLSIACNEAVKQQDGTWQNQGHFFELTLWGKQAESLKAYLVKGHQIAVQGRLKQQNWTDQQTGQSRSKVVVNVQSIELLAVPGNSAEPRNGSNGTNEPKVEYGGRQVQPNQGGDFQSRQYNAPRQQGFEGFSPSQNAFDPPSRGQGFYGPESFDDDIPF